jgi:hypothetical protein
VRFCDCKGRSAQERNFANLHCDEVIVNYEYSKGLLSLSKTSATNSACRLNECDGSVENSVGGLSKEVGG